MGGLTSGTSLPERLPSLWESLPAREFAGRGGGRRRRGERLPLIDEAWPAGKTHDREAARVVHFTSHSLDFTSSHSAPLSCVRPSCCARACLPFPSQPDLPACLPSRRLTPLTIPTCSCVRDTPDLIVPAGARDPPLTHPQTCTPTTTTFPPRTATLVQH